VQQIVALGAYSHLALKDMVQKTGIEFERLERGIAHFYSSRQAFAEAAEGVELMRQYGVQRRLVSHDEELLAIEPAFTPYAAIVGGTFTATDDPVMRVCSPKAGRPRPGRCIPLRPRHPEPAAARRASPPRCRFATAAMAPRAC
jgi:hypothetical protein